MYIGRTVERGGGLVGMRAGMTASLLAVVLTAGALAAAGSAAAASTAASRWQSRAVTAPPGAAENPEAQLDGIACTSATDCVASGYYQNKAGISLPMIATESDGRWARAITLEFPAGAGPKAVGKAGDVACWALGSCVALGEYQNSPTSASVLFIATESKGSWGRTRVVVQPANASPSPDATFGDVACPGRGSCIAVGSYEDGTGLPQSFTVSESNGRWQPAQEIRLPSRALGSQLGGVSCAAPGSCVAVGAYLPATGPDRGLEVTESDGTWRRGTTAVPPAGIAPKLGNFLTGVSCWAASCMAVGIYSAANGQLHPMAVSYARGRWHRAVALRAVPRGIGPHGITQLGSVACTAAGCMAVGQILGSGPGIVPVVASESGGRWKRAVAVPLPAGHTTGKLFQGYMAGIACSGRTCTAVGFFSHTRFRVLAMASTYR